MMDPAFLKFRLFLHLDYFYIALNQNASSGTVVVITISGGKVILRAEEGRSDSSDAKHLMQQ